MKYVKEYWWVLLIAVAIWYLYTHRKTGSASMVIEAGGAVIG